MAKPHVLPWTVVGHKCCLTKSVNIAGGGGCIPSIPTVEPPLTEMTFNVAFNLYYFLHIIVLGPIQ